jgi:TetR/AcrR family transcriptional regulator, cholesterol catabolism regulator
MEVQSNIAKRRMNALADGSSDYKAKRDELVMLAAKLFKEKGFKATTLNDIAKQAGVERASLYYYISSKEELFQEVVRGVTDANASAASKIMRLKSLGPKEKLQRLVELLMVSYEEYFPHMYVYMQEQMHTVAYSKTPWAKQMARQTRRFEEMVMSLVTEGMEAGIFRSDVPPRLATNALFGMFNWTHRWFKPGGKQNASEVSDAFCSIFFQGMCKP